MTDHIEWFAAKRYGYGAGLPIAWQGWAVLIAFLLSIGGAAWLFGTDDLRGLAIVVPATIALLIVTARTTRGGWRWRWGDD
jgi:hypothetical protein